MTGHGALEPARRQLQLQQQLLQQAPQPSAACPVVLVSGFLGPANEHWCKYYWGEAIGLNTPESPVILASVSCVGSCHDRACEIYAQLRGCRVDYGEDHAAECGHDRFGRDYTGKGKWPHWDEAHPVHLVGHSFGGNTVRALRYLLACDFFGHGTSSAFLRSTTTLSAPIKGTLLTYMLGASEDHDPSRPVRRFSTGYMLGMGVHLYELVAPRVGLDRFVDLGMDYWRFGEGGLKAFFRSHGSGPEGGGSPPIRALDNAAHDMTFAAAQEWCERVRRVLDADPYAFEFNLVAKKAGILTYTIQKARERLMPEGRLVSLPSLIYNSILVCRDLWVSLGASSVNSSDFGLVIQDKGKQRVDDHLVGESDGLCSSAAQFESDLVLGIGEAQRLAQHNQLRPGQYTIPLPDKHDHFSIVPFPDEAADQHTFFADLFAMLRSLPQPDYRRDRARPQRSEPISVASASGPSRESLHAKVGAFALWWVDIRR